MENKKTTQAQEIAFSQWRQEMSKKGWVGGKRVKFDEKRKIHPWLSYSSLRDLVTDEGRMSVKGKNSLVLKDIKKIEKKMEAEKAEAESVVNRDKVKASKSKAKKKTVKKVVKKKAKRKKRK